MTFEIIKLKQDMLVISKRIHIDKFEDQLNQQFASFIQSTPLTAPLKQQVIDIQNAVLVQFKNNNRLINEAQNRPVNAARLVDAYEFSAIKPLETLQSQITHFPKKTQDKIAQLIKKIKSLEKDCIKFNQAQKNLNEAMAALSGEPYQALVEIIKVLKDMPVSTFTPRGKPIMQKYLPSYIDDELGRELKQLAKNFEKNKKPLAEKLVPFQQFLPRRWDRIRETSRAYCAAPNDEFNRVCLELATAMANAVPELGRFSLLMPSVTVVRSDVTDNYFDDPSFKLQQIILNNDQSSFIEIESCLGFAENDALLKYTALVNGPNQELDFNEASEVVNHSQLTQQYYKAIIDLRNFTTGKYTTALIKPPGVYLQRLAEQLESGGAYHLDQAPRLLEGDARLATHNNAGEAANIGIVEFSNYLESLPNVEKDKLFKLRVYGATENFGEIWRRLSTPNAADLSDTRNCVELIAPQIRTILTQNHDLYNVLDFSIEQFQQALAQAKKAFQTGIHSDKYPIDHSVISQAEQKAINIALTDALLANEDELALKLVSLGASPDDRVQTSDLGPPQVKTTLLQLAVRLDKTAVVEKMLERPVSATTLRETLYYAINSRRTESALKILDHPINVVNSVDAQGTHFLVLAIQRENTKVVKKLLQKGAAIDYVDSKGLTPLNHLLDTLRPGLNEGLDLLFTFIDIPEVLDSKTIAHIFATIVKQHTYTPSNNRALDKFINKYKVAISDPANRTIIDNILKNREEWPNSFVKDVARRGQLPWLIKPMLLDHYRYANRSLDTFMYHIEDWSDAGQAELIGYVAPHLGPDDPNIVGNKHYYFEQALTRPRFNPLLARKLFDLGADPNVGKVFSRLVRKGEYDFALHIIASGRLTAKTLLDAINLPKLDPRVEKQLAEALAVIYEKGINKAVDELQYLVDSTKSLTSGLFKHVNMTVLAEAVTKLIAQLKDPEHMLEFSAPEIAALKNSQVAKIINQHKSNKDIPASYLKTHTLAEASNLKAHTLAELDKSVHASRGKGDTAKDKLNNTISAIELDLNRQQERLAARLLKNPNKSTRNNINVKLDAIMQAQDKINGFKNGEYKDEAVASLISNISAARDQARTAKSVTYAESAKKLFGKNLGDSETVNILNRAVKDLKKLDIEVVKQVKLKS
jgi:hypothetical protein